MKILIIQPWISYRGAESVSLEEARGLNKSGHKATVLCLFIDKEKMRAKDKKLAFILPHRSLAKFCQRSNIFFFLFGAFILLWLTFKHGKKFDIYNPHNFPSVWVAVLVSLITKRKVYWTVHNFPQHGFTDPVASKVWERATWKVDQLVISQLNGIVCVSEKVSRQVNKTYGRDAAIVHPPVDYQFYSGKTKPVSLPFSLNVKDRLVLIPARLHEVKNQMHALESIRKLIKLNRHIHVIFAGDGPMRERLLEYVNAHKLSENVSFIGFVSKDELKSLYAQADLVFLPGFIGEGFNIVVLEALSQGTPSLVLRGSGIDEWLFEKQVGFVTERSTNEIAMRLKYLLAHPNLLINAGRKGKALIKSKYTPEAYAKNLVKLFSK